MVTWVAKTKNVHKQPSATVNFILKYSHLVYIYDPLSQICTELLGLSHCKRTIPITTGTQKLQSLCTRLAAHNKTVLRLVILLHETVL